MLKRAEDLTRADPYFGGIVGFVGSSLEELYLDMVGCDIPETAPQSVRRAHDAVRHAYIYAYFSYDLVTMPTAQTFPCLELALRERTGAQFAGRVDKRGRPRPAMLQELLKTAKAQGLIQSEINYLSHMRNTFMHGSDFVLNPPMFLTTFQMVTTIIRGYFLLSRELNVIRLHAQSLMPSSSHISGMEVPRCDVATYVGRTNALVRAGFRPRAFAVGRLVIEGSRIRSR